MQISLPELNPSALSLDSGEGIILLLLIGFMIWCVVKRLFKFLWMAVGIVFLVQFLYVLGQTSFSTIIPINTVFKYDIFSALAQLCVGTKISEWLISFGTWLSNAMLPLCNLIAGIFTGDMHGVRSQIVK